MTLFATLAVQGPRVVTFEVAMDIEQQLKELEQRRKRGMRLLAADVWPAEVARRVGVSTIGAALEQAARQGWYGRAATAEALWSTAQARRCAARRVDQGIEGRSTSRGLYQRAVDASAHWDADQGALRRRVLAVFGLANAAAAGLERAAPHGTCARARRGGHPHLEREEVASDKKIAARQGRIIVFIDESGLSEWPC